MSVPSFLNNTSGPSSKPPSAAIVRHVTKKIIVAQPIVNTVKKPEVIHKQPVVIKAPPPTHTHESSVKREDILTFAVIAKILLSKTQVVELNKLFAKLLKNELNSHIISVKISNLVDTIPEVAKSWKMVNDKTASFTVQSDQLVNKVRTIIGWFVRNERPDSNIENYFNFIISAHKRSDSWVHIFSTILKQQQSVTSTKNISELMGYTKELLALIPMHKNPPETSIAYYSLSEFIDIEEPDKCFDLFRKIPKTIPLVPNKSGQQQPIPTRHTLANSKRCTPSHLILKSPVSENQNLFLFNVQTKLYPVSVDIAGRYIPPPPPSNTIVVKDLFQLLEDIEVCENKTDRIYSFSDINPYAAIYMRISGRECYESRWSEIEPHLNIPQVRDVVLNTCRGRLHRYEEDHQAALKNAAIYLTTRPTNAFLQSILITNMPNEFFFPNDDNDISNYLHHLLSSYSHPKLIQQIKWMFNSVMPLLLSPGIVNFVHSEAFAYLLWLYSLLCEEIRPLFNATALEMNSFEAVIDLACDEIHANNSFSGTEYHLHKALTDSLRSILQNRIVIDEIACDSVKHFGNLSEHIAHFYPIVEKITTVCNFLMTDHHMKLLTLCADKFGKYGTDATEEQINSRSIVYKTTIQKIRLNKLTRIRVNQKENKIVLSPFQNV